MENPQLFNLMLAGISVVAWAYFLFDRTNIIKRIDKHAGEIDALKRENGDLRGVTGNLSQSEILRGRLLDEQLGNLKMMLVDIKNSQEKQDGDIRRLNDKFIDAILNHKTNGHENS